MSWREELKGTASFRGVPFRTTDAAIGVGRRSVLNEYPLRDTPYNEDLGRRARLYEIEGYVIGDDYLDQRDALIEALETPGPGELVHPRYGSVWVSLHGDHVRLKEGPREGGIARFTIVFVEDSDNREPAAEVDTVAEIERTADALDQAAAVAYVDEVDLTGPQLLADLQALAASVDLGALVSAANEYMDSVGLGDLLTLASGLGAQLVDLVRTPLAFASAFRDIHLSLAVGIRTDDAPGGALNALQRIGLANRGDLQALTVFQRDQSAIAAGPSSAGRAALNDIARGALQRRQCICSQARVLAIAITDQAVATADQATTWRDQVVDQIDVELELAEPDATTARALSNLRAAVVRDVAERAELLRQRSTFTSVAVLPALVLAHRIYLDADRADELVQRNGVRHPAFVPAGALEILL